jgi:ABC-type multidrug transport system fused ATPase/permease subunit
MELYILVFIYVILDFILNHFSMMMETDIQSNIMYFGLLSMISLFLDYYGQHVLKQLSHAKKMEFLKKYIIKYEQLDQQSKEKGDPLSFKTLLDQASSVIEMKFNWRINVMLNFITTLFSVSYIIIINSQYMMLLIFTIINLSWYFIMIKNMMIELTSIKEVGRVERTILNDLSTLIMIQLHSGYAKIDCLLDNYTKQWFSNNKREIQWDKVSRTQRFPNKLVYIIIPFLVDPKLIISIYIVFKNLNSSISSIMGYMNQYKTFENQLQSLEDFFTAKTFIKTPQQMPLPKSFSFFGKVENLFTISNNLDISQGDRIRIEGPSGSGKTTFVKWLMGFVGEITYSEKQKPMSYNNDIIWMRQEIREYTPVRNTSIRQLTNNEMNDALIIKCLTIVGLLDWFHDTMKSQLDEKIHSKISGGEKTRLCIAITLIQLINTNGHMLILDEPEQGIHPEFASKLLQRIFNEFPTITILIITHLCSCQIQKIKFNKKWIFKNGTVISK